MKQNLVTELSSITPLDGRYKQKTQELCEYLSEYALIKYRLTVEIKYLITLSDNKIIRKLTPDELNLLNKIFLNFSLSQAQKIKKIEDKVRHDIKAVEIYLKLMFSKTSLKDTVEYVHFGLTSEDINNIAHRLMLKDAIEKIILPKLMIIQDNIFQKAKAYKNIPMLARTHGQNAIPTTFGKELFVFYKRLEKEILGLKKQKLTGKLNGAVGNFNALCFVYPKINWPKFSKEFISSFNLEPNIITTQINPFEDVIVVFQNLQRINGVLLDFNQDMWRYISDDWLRLAVKKEEVGSSTMPQKVNPIDFENSEGNLLLANGLMQAMIDKLYVSRLQRDLSSSTIIRNIGTALGYSLLAYKSVLTGITRIDVNLEKIEKDLNQDWSILSEALQIYLRKEKFEDGYFFVAKQIKGKKMDKNSWQKLISGLPIDKKHKEKLLTLTPKTYIGLASKMIT